MTLQLSPEAALAALAWQIELGADECIGEAPVNRFEAVAPVRSTAAAPVSARPATMPVAAVDPVAAAEAAAAGAGSLEALRDALAAYPHCDLREGAKSVVFADGDPAARVMIVGEAPGRDEDIEGRPFVGRAGQMLDRMLAAVGLGRTHPDPGQAVYITNVLPWRPPQNRDPAPAEVAMMLPFLRRHVDLVAPDMLVLMGNHACSALLGQKGITRLRGNWGQALGRPALPMLHPAYLLRNPSAKREAWADMLALAARLRETGGGPR
jgi:uracil-DNA glycosylase